MPKLTKRLIETLKPSDTDLWVWDSTLPGFGVRVMPSGRATFVMRYRTASGTARKHTLGRCTDLHPDEAREMAREAFAHVAKGGDPSGERKTLREAPTVSDLAKRHISDYASRLRPGTRRNYEILWRKHILPKLGSRKVAEATAADVLALHTAMSDTPINANRAQEVLNKAMELAEVWGMRPQNTNPCKPVKDYAEHVREYILTAPEIKRLSLRLTTWESVKPNMVALVRILMLTGCRVNEIAAARREWLDRERGILI